MVHVPLALVAALGGFVATALVVAFVGLLLTMKPSPLLRSVSE